MAGLDALVKERGRTHAKFARLARPPAGSRPCRVCSDFWFSSACSAGSAYVAVFSLANFVKYHPREIVVTIPPDKFLKNH